MITKDNLRNVLVKLGFKQNPNPLHDIMERRFDEIDSSITVDFANVKIYDDDRN